MTSTLYRPTPTGASGTALSGDPACIAEVTASGQLRLPAAPAEPTMLGRRTRTGTTYRIRLSDGITCWLGGDHYAGELNWPATQMCEQLSDGRFTGPDDAPFVCGPALFTCTDAEGAPIALSEPQLRRLVDAHAAATDQPIE
jgi:hypothetical protein